MIYLKTGHPISGMTLHVCTPPPDKVATPAVVAPVVAGCGGCTSQDVPGWQNAHELAQKAISRHWPFLAAAVSSDRACGGSAAAAGRSAAASSIPDGNHGDNNRSVQK